MLRYYGESYGLNSGVHRQIENLDFQNNDLKHAFQRSTQVDGPEMDKVDAGRPTKRPRLSDQTPTGVKNDLESELVGKLYDLMGMDRGVDLDCTSHGALFVDHLSELLQIC